MSDNIKIVSFKPPETKEAEIDICPEAIGLLEHCLELFKSGDYQHVAVTMVSNDGTSADAYFTGKPVLMIGAVEILKRELVDNEIDLRLHPSGEEY